MNNEINIMFNTHKIYKDGFLDDISVNFSETILNDQNVIVYRKNNLEVMIDKTGSVFMSNSERNNPELNEFITSALDEYDELIKSDNRFELKYPFKIISPKSITNSIKMSLKSLNLHYTQNEMTSDDSIYVFM